MTLEFPKHTKICEQLFIAGTILCQLVSAHFTSILCYQTSHSSPAMDLKSLAPLFYYAIASLLTITGLKRRRQTRLLLLGPIWLFSLMSLASSHRLRLSVAGKMVGADSTFASLVVFYLLYSAKTLVFDIHAVSPERSPHGHYWSLVDCYRTWNNPRQLPLRRSRLEGDTPAHGDPAPKSWRLLSFSLTRATKAAALWAFEHFVFRKVFIHALGQVIVADFSPAMEALSQLQPQQLSPHHLQVRAVMSVQWIWRAYFFLEFYHSLLAIVFVVILRFDDPGEWPPLFGTPLEAYSVRGFWGRFWHRLTVPTYVFYARLVSRRLMRVRPGSALEKIVTALLVFTISGLSHSLVGWALGDTALFRDVLFFEMCFLAAAGETAVSKMKMKAKALRMSGGFVAPPLQRVAGMVWVFVFFFCVSPSWIYPKIYHALLNPV
ncbi:membrane bound O-acyl transferase family-domain-containing protein [Aspergillus recurvatus]